MTTTPDLGPDHPQHLQHLKRCVELATEAVDAGDEAFGSVLVGADGRVLREARNQVGQGDETRHPELELALWAVVNLTPDDRAVATVYTSGEHCPMCSAAHAWVGLGPIVYAVGAAELAGWRAGWGLSDSAVNPLPIGDVAPRIPTTGPFPALATELRALHARAAGVPAD